MYLGILLFRPFKILERFQKLDFLFFHFFVSLKFSKLMKDTKNSPERRSTSSSQAAGLENVEPPIRAINQPASPRQRKSSNFGEIFNFSVILMFTTISWIFLQLDRILKIPMAMK